MVRCNVLLGVMCFAAAAYGSTSDDSNSNDGSCGSESQSGKPLLSKETVFDRETDARDRAPKKQFTPIFSKCPRPRSLSVGITPAARKVVVDCDERTHDWPPNKKGKHRPTQVQMKEKIHPGGKDYRDTHPFRAALPS